MNVWHTCRGWYRQQRVQRKLRHFTRMAVAQGWTTARLPHPSPLCRGRVLVLAPHVDDETIGCGGTLLLHRQAGDPIEIVHVLADPRQQTVREQEGNQVGAQLGATVTHLRCPRHLDVITQALQPLVARAQPAVTYVPWMLENHEDHLLVTQALARAIRQGAPCGAIWCYEVWTPLIPNRIVDITTVVERKQQLLAQYASQLAQNDVAGMSLGLSRYRAGLLAATEATAAEVFLALPPPTFIQQCEQAHKR